MYQNKSSNSKCDPAAGKIKTKSRKQLFRQLEFTRSKVHFCVILENALPESMISMCVNQQKMLEKSATVLKQV